VRVLARPNGNRRNLAGLEFEIAECSLEDAASLAQAAAGCRYLFHIAADYRLWVPDPAAMFRANVDGTHALMLATLTAGIERVVYTSSVATWGWSRASRRRGNAEQIWRHDRPLQTVEITAEAAVQTLIAERGPPRSSSTRRPVARRRCRLTGRLIVEAAGRAGHVDTGLNTVQPMTWLPGTFAAEHGAIGERYILGGENLTLAEILAEVAAAVGRRPPMLKIPYAAILPIAVGAELVARLTGREPFVTLDGARMSRKKMYFSSAKALRDLGYAPRPARQAIADAVAWFVANGYLRKGKN
jgi:dihydroflavonol-4-reductase